VARSSSGPKIMVFSVSAVFVAFFLSQGPRDYDVGRYFSMYVHCVVFTPMYISRVPIYTKKLLQ
jgi:hypothetical protein